MCIGAFEDQESKPAKEDETTFVLEAAKRIKTNSEYMRLLMHVPSYLLFHKLKVFLSMSLD